MKVQKLVLAGLIILALFAGCTSGPSASEMYESKPFTLTIFETSDLHADYFPYDFKSGKPMTTSLSNVVSLIQAERAKEGSNVLLLDGGDNLQGQPVISYYNFVKTDAPNIFSEIVNYVGYDAVVVGNHDVETGHAVYDKVVKEMKMPMLSANLVKKSDQTPYFKPYTVVNKGGVKIAILGLTTPGFRKNFPTVLYEGIQINDMVETAKKWVPIIQEKEKPDLIIGLFHAGADYNYAKGENKDTVLNENAAQLVAERVPGIDLVFIGHDHQGWDGKGLNKAEVIAPNGKVVPLFGAVDNGKKIPVVTVTMQYNKASKSWEKTVKGSLVDPTTTAPDPEFLAKFNAQFEETKTWVSRVIGSVNGVMYGRDSMFGDTAFVDLVHSLQLEITKDPQWGLKPAQISFCAPLDTGAVVPANPDGKIRVADMFSLYRYENWMYTMDLTGDQIRLFLEASYGDWFNTMKSKDDNLIAFKKLPDGKLDLDPRTNLPRTMVASYNYDSAAGINYTVDVTKPAGSRIVISSMSDGKPFDLKATYSVAINSYRAMGGGGLLAKATGWSADDLLNMKYVTSATTRDLRFYLTKWFENTNGKPVPVLADNNWKIIPEDLAAAGKAKDFALMYPSAK